MSKVTPQPLPSDADLVAFVDGRLDDESMAAITKRSFDNPALAERIAILRNGSPDLEKAFGPLLDGAPSSLADTIFSPSPEGASASAAGVSRRWLGFGAIAAVMSGAAGYLVGVSADTDNWRQAVAEYHALYGRQTTDRLNPSEMEADLELARVSAALGRQLQDVPRLAEGLIFKRAQILEFEGRPLIQIVLVAPDGNAVAYCLKRSRAAESPPKIESRKNMTLAFWTRDGIDELVVGRMNQQEITVLAQRLASRS